MPRKKREESSTGIYHWIVHGMNKKDIFHDAEDYKRFKDLLIEYKSTYQIIIYYQFPEHFQKCHIQSEPGTSGNVPILFMNKKMPVSFLWILSAIVACIFLFEAGCASSDDPEKRKHRALAGGATSTALGVATGVGGPILLARAVLGATGRVATGEVMDKMKEKDGGEVKQPVEDKETVEKH